MMLDIPGLEAPEKWLEAIAPATDEGVAETARRIAAIRKSYQDQGIPESGTGKPEERD